MQIILANTIPVKLYVEFGYSTADIKILLITLHQKKPQGASGQLKILDFEGRLVINARDDLEDITWGNETGYDFTAEQMDDAEYPEAICFLLELSSQGAN